MGGSTVARLKVGGVDGPGTAYLHADHLDSPVAATDEAGRILWAEQFSPFGESIPGPAANPDDEGFTGHIQDAATGLTYMQARYYDPVIGRFLSNDPVGFAEGGVQYFNRYVYTANDPVNAIDPDGRQQTALGALFGPPVPINGANGQQIGQYNRQGGALGLQAGLGTFTGGAAAVGSVAVPGPEDALLGAAAATRIGGAIARAADDVSDAIGGALRGADTTPKPGQAGGPGAGRDFSESTRDAARAESGDTCVFCGQDTVRSPTPAPNRSNIDHAIPKVRGGNNSLDNAQNTCQTCNLRKGTQTTEEFLAGGG